MIFSATSVAVLSELRSQKLFTAEDAKKIVEVAKKKSANEIRVADCEIQINPDSAVPESFISPVLDPVTK